MISPSDEGSEPPPPDICGYTNVNLQVHSDISHLSTATDSTQINDREDGSDRPATKTLRGKKGRSTMTRRLASPLLITCVMIALLPLASAQTQSAYDPYTSYDPHARKGRQRSRPTPILSFLRWALDGASAQISNFIEHASSSESGAGAGARIGKRELSTGEIVEACMIPLLVCLSGVFAGLTLGYFSVDPTQLQVLSISGTPKQQQYARRILPVRKDSHLLLTTLILGNMIVNEALPVVMDNVIGGGIYAVIASTALVVIFAEIIPQSVCSRYGLLIGASMAWPVRVMMWIAFPIAWPIAKLLEYILGAHHGIIYRRSELRELIKMHAAGAEGGGDLDFDTVQMAQGALDLAQKSVKEAMTPIDQVFMLPIDAKLDYETLGHVVRSGHSRIPVYQMVEVPDINLAAPTTGFSKTKMVKKVLGSLLVKSCVLLDPEDATPLATIPINAIPSVPFDERLTNMLNVFQEGRSHMAIVSRRPRRVENGPEDAQSVMTEAAGGLRQRFMRKVAGISHGNRSDSEGSGSDTDSDVERGDKEKRRTRRKHKRAQSGSETTALSPTTTVAGSATAAEEFKEDTKNQEKKKGLVQLEQTVPADAQMPANAVDKFFEGLEGAPLGIITLEDVLEELIGEEIYDEYDEHGVPRSDASAFVPREAMLAARSAAMARQQLALAQSTPLPGENDTDLLQPSATGQAQGRRVMPKLPLPLAKFGLGKKTASQPGRSRTEDLSLRATPTPSRASTPGARRGSTGDKPLSTKQAEASMIVDDKDQPPSRTQSEIKFNARRSSVLLDGPGATVPLKGVDPVTSVPARLLSAGVSATFNGAPPSAQAQNATLNEALMISKMQRAGPPAAAGNGNGIAPSGSGVGPSTTASGVARSASTPVPPRQATPPISSGVAAAPASSSKTQATSSQSQSHSQSLVAPGSGSGTGTMNQQSVNGTKKVPKFKSVPAAAPFVATPGTEKGDPLERKE